MSTELTAREAPASYVLDAQRVSPEYKCPKGDKQTEVGVIPGDWDVLSLFEIAGESKARFDDGDWIEAKYLTASGVRLVQTGNIGEGCFIEKELKKYISEASFTNLGCKEIVAGDVLICRLAAPAGRACVFPDIGEEKVITSVDVTILRPVQDIADEKYLCHVFTKQSWLALVGLRCGGTTHSRISRSELGKLTIALPKLKEQRAIAGALSDADALIEALEQLIAKKRDLKQGAMQQLLTGKKRLPGFGGEWEVKRLQETTDCLDNLRVPLNETQRNQMRGDYPYCGANGVLDFVNDYVLDDDIILIAEDGGYFDEYAYRPIAYRMTGKCWVNNHAHILKAKEGNNQDFLYYSLVHKNILNFLASGTRAKLNKSEMWKIEINVPSTLPEQTAIATILSDMDTEIAALETRLAKTRELKQGMMHNLLTGKIRLL